MGDYDWTGRYVVSSGQLPLGGSKEFRGISAIRFVLNAWLPVGVEIEIALFETEAFHGGELILDS